MSRRFLALTIFVFAQTWLIEIVAFLPRGKKATILSGKFRRQKKEPWQDFRRNPARACITSPSHAERG